MKREEALAEIARLQQSMDELRKLLTPEEATMPNVVCWATSTRSHGPKSYFILIKEQPEQIALEIKYDAQDRSVTSDVYVPEDYDYTVHDACDHENGECIEDDPRFQEEMWIATKAAKVGIKTTGQKNAERSKEATS